MSESFLPFEEQCIEMMTEVALEFISKTGGIYVPVYGTDRGKICKFWFDLKFNGRVKSGFNVSVSLFKVKRHVLLMRFREVLASRLPLLTAFDISSDYMARYSFQVVSGPSWIAIYCTGGDEISDEEALDVMRTTLRLVMSHVTIEVQPCIAHANFIGNTGHLLWE
jgi:hypothetical protein